MSNLSNIIPERAADIGNFLVGRLLPFREKRMVGPFVFIDHMGPADMGPDENLDVGPHPHIGLSTLTYLFEGSIVHRDSLGTSLEITPGAVNWMTAGHGVTHSERTPEDKRGAQKTLHGLQIWVALPAHLEDMDPSFDHIAADSLPTWNQDGIKYKLIAGSYDNKQSPVPVYSPMYMIEMKASEETEVDFNGTLYGETGVYILNGGLRIDDTVYEPKQILVAHDCNLCQFTMLAGTTIYIFGGEPFEEERHINWNFVSTSKEKISAARERWKNHNFPKVPGDDDYVPLPSLQRKADRKTPRP